MLDSNDFWTNERRRSKLPVRERGDQKDAPLVVWGLSRFFWGVGLIHLRLEDPQRLIATGHMPHCQLPPHGKGYLLTGAICKDGRLTQLSADIVRMVEGHSMGVIFGLYPKQSHSPS